jgi:hypothetical protein
MVELTMSVPRRPTPEIADPAFESIELLEIVLL